MQPDAARPLQSGVGSRARLRRCETNSFVAPMVAAAQELERQKGRSGRARLRSGMEDLSARNNGAASAPKPGQRSGGCGESAGSS